MLKQEREEKASRKEARANQKRLPKRDFSNLLLTYYNTFINRTKNYSAQL